MKFGTYPDSEKAYDVDSIYNQDTPDILPEKIFSDSERIPLCLYADVVQPCEVGDVREDTDPFDADEVHLRYELSQELPRHDPDVAFEALGDLSHEPVDELGGDGGLDTVPVLRRIQIELTQPQGHGPQAVGVEGSELELGLPQGCEASLLHEPYPVVQRGQPRDAAALIEELVHDHTIG